MKTTLLATLLLLTAPIEAQAYRTHFGVANTQVRDEVFEEFSDDALNRFDLGDARFLNTFFVGLSLPLRPQVELLGQLRLGNDSGTFEGVGATLNFIEPAVGARYVWSAYQSTDLYGQTTVAVPLARMSLNTGRRDALTKAWGVAVTPALGVAYFPTWNKKDQRAGVAFEIGYTAGNDWQFSSIGKADPGDLDYGGVTYGLFFTWRSDDGLRKGTAAAPTASKVETPIFEPAKETVAPAEPTTDSSAQPSVETSENPQPDQPGVSSEPNGQSPQ